jgi:drug/metabolite transporter (DMT)-like permease
MTKKQLTSHGFALFTILIWGTTFVATKVLLEDMSPIQILVYRFVLGYLALWLLAPKPLKLASPRQELWFAAAGVTGITVYQMMENVALTMTTASNVGVIISSAPLFTGIAAMLVSRGKEKLKWGFYLGFAVSMVGIALISYTGASEFQLDWRGDLLSLLAAVVWAVYSVVAQKIGTFGYPTIQSTRRMFFYALLAMIPMGAMTGFELDLAPLTNLAHLGSICYLGLGASALCFMTWNTAIQHLGTVQTTVYLYLSPVITVVCSILVLSEGVTWMSVLGIALTLAGLVVSQWGTVQEEKQEDTSCTESTL